MIRQFFELRKYGWQVCVYYAVDTYYTDEIMDKLASIGCDEESMHRAWVNLSTGNMNTGLTYSNFENRMTVMVIALTSSAEEFQNSLDHEKGHICRQIVQAEGIDPFGEEAQYLAGDIGQLMFPVAKFLLCDCCRYKVKKMVENTCPRNFHERLIRPDWRIMTEDSHMRW